VEKEGSAVGRKGPHGLRETTCGVRDEGARFTSTAEEREPSSRRGASGPDFSRESVNCCLDGRLVSQVYTSPLARRTGGGSSPFSSFLAAHCRS
jgi:hypothetical protein